MFASREIYERFAECYAVKSAAHLAGILKLAPQTVQAWRRADAPVPPIRLKKVVDEMGISWDWLIKGTEPKRRPDCETYPTKGFDWKSINTRFLDLFSGKTQDQIAEELGIKQVNVSRLKSGDMHTPWEKLKYAAVTYNVTWDWLMEGDEI